MAKIDDLRKEKQLLEEQASLQQSLYESDRRRTTALRESQKIQQNILEIEKRIKKLADLDTTGEKLSLEKQIEKLQKSGLNSMKKELGLEQQILGLQDIAASGDKEKIKSARKFTQLLDDINSGNKDISEILNIIATEDFGILNKRAMDLGELLSEYPHIMENLGKEKKFADMLDQVKDTLGLIDLKKTFTFAGILALATKFAGKVMDIRQSLGTGAVESAKLAANMTAAGTTAKFLGGNASEAEAAVEGMVNEFGTLNSVSLGVATSLGDLVASTGISGANAAKLLKTMKGVSGASIETNIAMLKSVGNLAKAEGLAPAQILNDIAENTELFAQFGKAGGDNIAAAAIQAKKLGLNLSTVAGITESLLDFESSIEKQMEAQVLLGRSLNLDKARELSLAGDLEGLQKEVLSQVGSQAEFEAMNVVQRKALADAIGVSVNDLGKMVAREKTSAQLAKDKEESQKEMNLMQLDMNKMMVVSQGITAAIATIQAGINIAKGIQVGLTKKNTKSELAGAGATVVKAAAEAGKSAAMVPFIGAGLAIAAIAAVGAIGYKMLSKAPKAETGGIVTQSGLAQIHKGEAISGTKNELGFGADMTETNRILRNVVGESKKLREQNEFLMNKLIRKQDNLALANT
tara:strand:- start:5466 stop:7373 length:1908 start_codon:yes stop_codon:yes gene_type:complete